MTNSLAYLARLARGGLGQVAGRRSSGRGSGEPSWSPATASLSTFVGITFGRDKDSMASTKAVP
jgi:hypothetical protein